MIKNMGLFLVPFYKYLQVYIVRKLHYIYFHFGYFEEHTKRNKL